jgi:hypothetical protein
MLNAQPGYAAGLPPSPKAVAWQAPTCRAVARLSGAKAEHPMTEGVEASVCSFAGAFWHKRRYNLFATR